MVRRTTSALLVSLSLFAGDASADDVVDLAASLIGRPYVWGAEGPRAFDCSGLTQYVFQQIGLNIPRRAVEQSGFGDRTSRLRRGDLVFFSTDTRRSLVTHVGIYEGGGVMIDASKSYGRVRRDNLDDQYWAARFMGARRVASDIAWRGDGDRDWPADGDVGQPPERKRDGRRETVRALGRLAETLLRRRW
jgi:cell wall-associated NlpC family hydrolase